MKSLFARNISNTGRLVRGVGAVGLLVGAGFSYFLSVWLGVTLAVFGVFVLFEALRGWCLLRACGIRTKL
ncbi:MAG: YgaP-like transmembrane domain [Verrucomicrobiota bacterium]